MRILPIAPVSQSRIEIRSQQCAGRNEEKFEHIACYVAALGRDFYPRNYSCKFMAYQRAINNAEITRKVSLGKKANPASNNCFKCANDSSHFSWLHITPSLLVAYQV